MVSSLLVLFAGALLVAAAAEPELYIEGDEALGERSLVVGNFDADELPDVAASGTRFGSAIVVIRLSGRAAPFAFVLPSGVGTAALVAADRDADGRDELLVGFPGAVDGGGLLTGVFMVLDEFDDAADGDDALGAASLAVYGTFDTSPAFLGIALAAADLDGAPGLEALVGEPGSGKLRTFAHDLEGSSLGAATARAGEWSDVDGEGVGSLAGWFTDPTSLTPRVVTGLCRDPWNPVTTQCDDFVALVFDGALWDGDHLIASGQRLVGADTLLGFPTRVEAVPDPRALEPEVLLWASDDAVQLVSLTPPRSVALTLPGSTAAAVLDCGGQVRLATGGDGGAWVLNTTLVDQVSADLQTAVDGASYALPAAVGRLAAADLDGDGQDELLMSTRASRAIYVAHPCAELADADTDTDTDTDTDADTDTDTDADTDADTDTDADADTGGEAPPFGWACQPCDPGSATAAGMIGVGLTLVRRRRAFRV